MAHAPQNLQNPCLLDENEQIPAKIWELLRRNENFRADVARLTKLDAKERNNWKKTGKYHGPAWQKSWRLVERIEAQHPFAGVALQWLVPEPLFHCSIVTRSRGKKWTEQAGEGMTPDINDEKHWSWRDPSQLDVGGHPMRRGPEVYWTKSKFKRFRSWVNPIMEWRRYSWPFTVEHSWTDAPPEFRRRFQFIWRRHFDSRPTNPITKDRRDSPAPHETNFFHGWNLMQLVSRAHGQIRQANEWLLKAPFPSLPTKIGSLTKVPQAELRLTDLESARLFTFDELVQDYRVFATPKTILTKASADAMCDWLADELKKGSDLYGNLLKGKLLNEGELLGTASEWADWLAYKAKQISGTAKDTHFYRRCRYMKSLVSLIYPVFDIARLLAPPKHRARGKKYVPKGRQN